jgi:hypothetical protein
MGGALFLVSSALTFNFKEINAIPCQKGRTGTNQGQLSMVAAVVVRAALSAISMLFGGLGMFFLYFSFSSDSALSAYALIFIVSASGIVWSLDDQQTRRR